MKKLKLSGKMITIDLKPDEDKVDGDRCNAIYSGKECGGLMVDEGYGDWPRCDRCGTT